MSIDILIILQYTLRITLFMNIKHISKKEQSFWMYNNIFLNMQIISYSCITLQ